MVFIFKKDKIIKLIIPLLLVVLTGYWLLTSYKTHTFSNKKADQSLLFWNIARNTNYNQEKLREIINEDNPDIIVLVEAPFTTEGDTTGLGTTFKNYTIRQLNRHMVFATKGNINSTKFIGEDQNFNMNIIEFSNQSNNYKLGIADVYASPFHYKKDALHKINKTAIQEQFDFLVGDFNTPYESVNFKAYKKHFSTAREYQSGFTATWLFGIPLLELDQIWVTKSIKINNLETIHTFKSDHEALLLSFE